jgi:hypothetical protein
VSRPRLYCRISNGARLLVPRGREGEFDTLDTETIHGSDMYTNTVYLEAFSYSGDMTES